MERKRVQPGLLATWAAHRPVALAAAIYLLLSLLMFAPGLMPGRTVSGSDELWTATPWDSSRPPDIPVLGSNPELADAFSIFHPALRRTRAVLPDIPLWDTDTLGGRPFLADPQTAVFSPFSLPSYVLPFWKSLPVVAVLKLFVAALGTFLLGRAVGMRFGGALLAGLVYGFSLWMVTWIAWPHSSVWAFLPWLCVTCEWCVQRPGPLPVAGIAGVVGLQWVGGHPSSSTQILLAVGLFWLARVLLMRPLGRQTWRQLLCLGGGLVLGTALAAIALIPFVQLLLHSSDLEGRAAGNAMLVQPPRFLVGLFLYDYWGHGHSGLVFGSYLLERAYYVAALPLMLGAAAVVAKLRVERVTVAVVAASTLLISTGRWPFWDLVVALPGLDAANNGRFAVVAVLCLAVLAGWGLDDLCTGGLSKRRRQVIVAVAVAILSGPAVWAATRIDPDALGSALRVAWGFEHPSPKLISADAGGLTGLVRLAALLKWVVPATLGVALIVFRVTGRLGVATFVGFAMLLTAGDLFRAGMGFNPAIPISHAAQPTTAAIRFLQDQRPARFVGLTPTARYSLALPIPPNVASRLNVIDARGYVIPSERRTHELWRRAIAPHGCPGFFCTVLAGDSARSRRALGLLGVSLMLQNRRDAPLRGVGVAYAGPDARIYRNSAALPRAFLVDRQLVVRSGNRALAAVTDAGFPARVAAVTEDQIPGLKPDVTAPARPAGTARITDYERERVVVRTRGQDRALLVLTDTWFPGWKATVDGAAAPVHRVDYLLRGVSVPAGSHRVELRFEPASWRAGWIVSLLALVAVGGLVAVGRRRGGIDRRASAPGGG
jgi:hypothetical protein